MIRRGIVLLAMVVVGLSLGCQRADDAAHKKKLDALVAREATRADVARELGEEYDFFEKGTPSWDRLQGFLNGEPQSELVAVRENAHKCSRVMYYTTMWRMTWIFLDDRDVIRTYCLAAQ
jgi:hypothetical protein